MSPVPPEPQATNAPPSFNSDSREPEPTTTKSTDFPEPKLRLELRDVCHQSTDLFLKNFNSAKDLAELVDTVFRRLYTVQDDKQDASTTRPTPSHTLIPGTRSVTLIVREMDGVAYTTGMDIDDDHKEIHLSLSYLDHVGSQKDQPARKEILGVVCHELVHCFQWNANGTANGGLIEGIADWVRLNAGFVPPHWKREAGKEWDAGYQNTGYFLDWIEKTRGKGSIYKLNQALCNKDYEDDTFWKELFGQSVDSLWKEYGKSLKKNKSDQYGDPNKKMEIRIRKQDTSEETAEDGNDH